MVHGVSGSAGAAPPLPGGPASAAATATFAAVLAGARARTTAERPRSLALAPSSPLPGRGATPPTPGFPVDLRRPTFAPSATSAAPRATSGGPPAPLLDARSTDPAADQIDPARITWLDADVGGWARTSRIGRVGIDGQTVTIAHTRAGRWPTVRLGDKALEGNPWVLVQRGGRWYAATYEWLVPGQTTKRITGEDLAAAIGEHRGLPFPAAAFAPRPGELVGFMVSAPARGDRRSVRERSNIVLARWPADGGPSGYAPSSGPGGGTDARPGGAPLSGPNALHHRTDFLTMRGEADQTIYTHEYAGLSPADRAAVRQALRARGYTHAYVYVVNEGDYGGRTRFDFYEDPLRFRTILQELVDDGIAPVVWLAPDDASAFHRANPPARLATRWERVVPLIDDLVAGYVPGLEADEYWSDREQHELGRALRALTAKPIFVHNTAGRWELGRAPWASGVIYQYGFGLDEAQIAERTRELVARLAPLGKTVIAGEYAHRVGEALAGRLGDAALAAGADGVGNGASRG
jgi:hypothetical protein